MNTHGGRTILVGVTGSLASTAALRWAAAAAEREHARLRLVLVWAPERRASYARPAGRSDAHQAQERARRKLAETMRTVLGPGPLRHTTAEVVEGMADRALVVESAGADLLVLGSAARSSGWNSIGPVVRTCLAGARCPVVVVSPEGCPVDRARARRTRTEGDEDEPSGDATRRDAASPRRGVLRLP
jgi:nucleotide-binding universal stress UspA family protein